MSDEQRLDFEDGKYTLILAEDGYTVTALRYGEPWRTFVGDKFITHLAQAVFEKAQASTDDEREDMIAWLMRDQGDDLSPLGRDYTDAEIADMLRRPAQAEPSDDEREALELLIAKLREAKYPEGLDAWVTGDVAHAIMAAGFRRPVQGDYFEGFEEGVAVGRGIPAQTEPTPFNGKWVCGKCDRGVAQGVDDGQIPEHYRTCHKRAQDEPQSEERY